MTSNQVRGIAAETVEEQAVVQYLQHNPDFFERHPQLLARLRLPHPRGGSTISLVERQIEVLREKIQARRSRSWRSSCAWRAPTTRSPRSSIASRAGCCAPAVPAPAIADIEASLREDFDAFHAVLVLAAAACRMRTSCAALRAPRGGR